MANEQSSTPERPTKPLGDVAAAAAKAATESLKAARPARTARPAVSPQPVPVAPVVAPESAFESGPEPLSAIAAEPAAPDVPHAAPAAPEEAALAASPAIDAIGRALPGTVAPDASPAFAAVSPGAQTGPAADEHAADITAASAATATNTTTPHMERMMTTAEDFMAFGQGNIEAFVKAGQIWAAGMQDLGRTVADSAQAHIDHNVTTFKALAGVKSLREAIDLQSSHARAALEKAVQDGGKLTDASLKLAEQVIAPITARIGAVSDRFGRAA